MLKNFGKVKTLTLKRKIETQSAAILILDISWGNINKVLSTRASSDKRRNLWSVQGPLFSYWWPKEIL